MNLIAVPHACMCFSCTCVYASLKAVSRPGFANRPKCCSLCRKGHSDVPRLSVPSLHLSNPRPPPLYLSADILPSVFMPYSWSQRSKSWAEPCVSSVSFLFISTLLKFAPCLCLPIGHPSQSRLLLPEFYWCVSSLCVQLFLNTTHHMIDR